MITTYSKTFYKLVAETVRISIQQGGTSCFGPNQLIQTINGSIEISKIKTGEQVQTFNEETKEIETKVVQDIFRFVNTKKTYKITLKNGSTIICTEDHEFYVKGVWISLKHLLSL